MTDCLHSVTFYHFSLAFWRFFGLKLSLCRHFTPNHITTKGYSLVSKLSFTYRQTTRKVPSNSKSPKSDRKWQMKHRSVTYNTNNIRNLYEKVTDDGCFSSQSFFTFAAWLVHTCINLDRVRFCFILLLVLVSYWFVIWKHLVLAGRRALNALFDLQDRWRFVWGYTLSY